MRFIVVLLALLFVQVAIGQDNPGSKIKVQFVNGYWMVDFKTDNVSAMEALKKSDPSFKPSEIGTDGVEKAYRSYLKKSFSLKVDTTNINVKFVSAEINSARANAKFISTRFKESGKVITIKSTAYSKLDKHPIKLIVEVGEEKHVSWLNESNAYECTVELTGSED